MRSAGMLTVSRPARRTGTRSVPTESTAIAAPQNRAPPQDTLAKRRQEIQVMTNVNRTTLNRRRLVQGSTAAAGGFALVRIAPVSYTHLRAHETVLDLVCRL